MYTTINHIYFFVDINECKQGIHNCGEKAMCENTYSNFRCICPDGYSGNGTDCTGISMHIHVIIAMLKYEHHHFLNQKLMNALEIITALKIVFVKIPMGAMNVCAKMVKALKNQSAVYVCCSILNRYIY